MSEPSPPVRVTRARAAAKTDPKLNIATAASKAKTSRTTTTTKRKTRADESKDDDQDELNEILPAIIEPEAPKTRGRQKKAPAMQSEPEDAPAPAPKPRGRPRKTVVEAPAAEPSRATRGRAKKMEDANNADDEIVVAVEPPKRTTRGRAATVSKPAAPKKTVKFEEPDKENLIPTATKEKAKVDAATGLRAKPVRKPVASTTTRATRGRAKVEEKPEKTSPLSPKKITQIATAKESSEDELATTEKTPMKPLMKSPVKPPGSIFGTAKKLDFTSNNITANRVSVHQDLSASMMASPARRPPQSPFKDALKSSPQKLVFDNSLTRSPFKHSFPAPKSAAKDPELKASLLQSPARRPQSSPIKVADNGSPSKSHSSASLFGQTPKATPFKISRFGTPKTISMTPRQPLMASLSTAKPATTPIAQEVQGTSLEFSGRLSSIMPREADPAFHTEEVIAEETAQGSEDNEMPAPESMAIDEVDNEVDASLVPTLDETKNYEAVPSSAFRLRKRDESPFDDSDSEDELASSSPRYSPSAKSAATPSSFAVDSRTPGTAFSKKRAARRSEVGFTPLAKQLSTWMAASPESDRGSGSETEHPSPLRSNPVNAEVQEELVQPSPAKSTFFEDAMAACDESAVVEDTPVFLEEDPNFSPVELLVEDLDLAAEADEMSILEQDVAEDVEECVEDRGQENMKDDIEEGSPSCLDEPTLESEPVVETQAEPELIDESGPAPSEASQEYGDENAIPIDPELLPLPESQATSFSTPKRVLAERVFHTVSKVPLKPAAEDSPVNVQRKKRSASISRLPVSRPSSKLSRSNTVISYSPAKNTTQSTRKQVTSQDATMTDAPETPSKPETVNWSTVGTPARTPRRDLNSALLKGAIVFVDVHTSEGADASVLFTELLTQMGARCVKSWNWSGNGEESGKVGITHIVFKDGGKRTLEKARATGGVVSCVGVGWVLDCERENKWLDESIYAVDTAEVPRGGHRRRKSMEPRALANMNGTLMTPSAKTPMRNNSPTKEFLNLETPGTSKSRRRESLQWVRSPASSTSTEDQLDDQTMALSPIPATPAPETISAYGEAYLDRLNAGEQTPGEESPYFLHQEKIVQMTAPPKQRSAPGDGMGFLSTKKDESVMMRLMAARRKSLQWAPKVGSPLKESSHWAL
ncbi:hypothetical protein BP6252_07407 [Coleophoma cylindrospora]|uniref:BRCT domain-containing protein n=1 Tax=Coleophoma cylindrospora TaxID=1849047 RepID=A0A3D8RHQ0_9HELO|nr:hypothetical protein BP6252_07407 [Coleophoma cylindrospora]